MANVRLEKVSRRFGNVTAIEDINLTIPDGEFWVFVGPSGCGKSTIMRIIAGLETVTTGQIYIEDVLVNEVPARARDVAMVFQNYALYPHMTVAENLAFGLKMRNLESSTIRHRVEMIARSLDIDHLLQRKPKQLSGGQQQRVALGRAIVREPKVFLLDEPLSNLDAQLRDDTRAELKQLHSRLGITTIYVTHDQIEAMTLADQIVVLNQGKIQQIGNPQIVYALPSNRMVATFLGNPPMNILPATYLGKSFQIDEQFIACPVEFIEAVQPKSGQGFDLGIRPEHIVILNPEEIEETETYTWLKLEIQLVEPLGRETLIRANFPGLTKPINIQAPAYWRGQPGDSLFIELNLEYLFIFDASNGEVLYPQVG